MSVAHTLPVSGVSLSLPVSGVRPIKSHGNWQTPIHLSDCPQILQVGDLHVWKVISSHTNIPN